MSELSGAYPAKKKNGSIYYRASITYRMKHISLGSYLFKEEASKAYHEAADILFTLPSPPFGGASGRPAIYAGHQPESSVLASHLSSTTGYKDELQIADEYLSVKRTLSFEKWILLKNFKENGIYCKTPIYLKKQYFIYYLDTATPLKFDAEDLFYYKEHKIMKRGGYLFVADYGMQVNILSRYGVKNHAVLGRDYQFMNGDPLDFRYHNIKIINRYYGVQQQKAGRTSFLVKIHVKGDLVVGWYNSEIEAAVAYNKAADILKRNGIIKSFHENYIEGLRGWEYAKIYSDVQVSRSIKEYVL